MEDFPSFLDFLEDELPPEWKAGDIVTLECEDGETAYRMIEKIEGCRMFLIEAKT